jgi:hypothetical protein
MTRYFSFKTLLVVSVLLMLPVAQAATISKADYKADKSRVSATYKTDKAVCASLSGNAKDICGEEAKAKEKVAYAELEFSFSGKSSDQTKVLVAKAKSDYEVAKQKCHDKAGKDKDVCVKEAKAGETKALADAKMGKEIHEAKKIASEDKREADYKVAVEKCDALAGDAKASCIAAAKANLGKN